MNKKKKQNNKNPAQNFEDVADSLQKTLLKKALGYEVCESTEEFASSDDGETLQKVKIKVTNKHCPPDLAAMKILLELQNSNSSPLADMTDEQLEEEKLRLLRLLSQTQKQEDVSDEDLEN